MHPPRSQGDSASSISDARTYLELGVSTTKADVYAAIASLPTGLSDRTFCKVLPDIFAGDDSFLTACHSDGAGSKSLLAYLHYRLTGKLDSFRAIAQDAIVMNLDDLACVGATSPFLLTSVINRNISRIDGAVLREIIHGTQAFTEHLRQFDIDITLAGGETADVGDLVQTLLVDATLTCRFPRSALIENIIQPGMSIVGLASGGPPSKYESTWNSGIGCNGITLARHALLSRDALGAFPELTDPSANEANVYRGPFEPLSPLPGTNSTVLDALLCPTRTYAPIMRTVFRECRHGIHAIVHLTGGAHTKCAKFAEACTIEKDLGKDIPPIFRVIQSTSHLSWPEMAKVFNLGVRMELFCDTAAIDDVIAIAAAFGVPARQIGRVSSPAKAGGVELRVRIDDQDYDLT